MTDCPSCSSGAGQAPIHRCISEISDCLYKGHYPLVWTNGKKLFHDTYVNTCKRCEKKPKELFAKIKIGLVKLKEQKV